tara:strand:- start:554 stop:700 length:147 start_codon:yes stop_codon:yes gene_type:complete
MSHELRIAAPPLMAGVSLSIIIKVYRPPVGTEQFLIGDQVRVGGDLGA